MQGGVCLACGCTYMQTAAGSVAFPLRTHVGVRCEAEAYDAMRSSELLPDRNMDVVGIDHGDPLRPQARKYFAFRMRNAFDGTETF